MPTKADKFELVDLEGILLQRLDELPSVFSPKEQL